MYRLPALEAPAPSPALTAALTFPAVRLFVDRAAAGIADFKLSDADASVVAEICHNLDRMTLAIELAGGRVDAFGTRGVAALLDDRFHLLMHGRRTALPRHRTLGGTLDWSLRISAGAGAARAAPSVDLCRWFPAAHR